MSDLISRQPETHDKCTEMHACDCISRQAAINALTSHIMPHNNEDGTVTIGVLSKSSIKNILNKLPSAQPDSKELSGTHKALDTVSRQAVIEINRSYHGQMPNEVNHRIWKEINELPSAQPETHEERTETHACDLIDRQAAIDVEDGK